MSNKLTITQALTILAASLGAPMTEQRLEIYVESLADLSLEQLLPAIAAIKETHIYNSMPTIGAIRAKAADLELTRQGVPDALEAWASVSRGPRNEAHPMAQEAFRQLGGWSAFGRSDVSAEASWRARFIDAYTTITTRYRHNNLLLSKGTQEAAGLIEAGENVGKVDNAISGLLGSMKR